MNILLLTWKTLRPFAVAAFIAMTAAGTAAADKPARPIPAVEHVIVVSIDGLRPDLALRANMPTLRGMLREGAYTFWAKTTAVSITLPSHTSMLTGVAPDKHGILWNEDLPLSKPVYPAYPTVMDSATASGLSTAMVAGKSKFATLNKPGTIQHVFTPAAANSSVDNETVATEAEKIIGAYRPEFLFIHFPEVDGVGHSHGWGSPEQIATIENTDRQLTRILAALDRARIRSSTLLILSADHGGAGLSHGAEDARSRHIPWIAVGPGVKRGYDLTQIASLEVRTEDTAATVCYLLGLPQQPYFDGKPVLAAFSE